MLYHDPIVQANEGLRFRSWTGLGGRSYSTDEVPIPSWNWSEPSALTPARFVSRKIVQVVGASQAPDLRITSPTYRQDVQAVGASDAAGVRTTSPMLQLFVQANMRLKGGLCSYRHDLSHDSRIKEGNVGCAHDQYHGRTAGAHALSGLMHNTELKHAKQKRKHTKVA
ncbi:hypothetical protein F511_06970 [Dorcoceras hygrometricum]|uniref:Uncharacterized protein n=1 Tax=Dorcoceras hygrometricum TaxID=472368 RepID=A0A2Z7B8Y8_9LAMI|nr:hypothetical protein F511_06970 [Dorcoceras hygrometricum]